MLWPMYYQLYAYMYMTVLYLTGSMRYTGGTPRDIHVAQENSWRDMIQFFNVNLS